MWPIGISLHIHVWGWAEKFIGWLTLNPTFPETKCIVSFQRNPHRISNSGLWKVVLETFRERPGKLTKGVLFHQDNVPAHKSVVAMAAVRDCGFELVDHSLYSPEVWHHLTIFCSPTLKDTWLGSSLSDRWWGHSCIYSWGLFRGSGWVLLYHENPSAATQMEEVCGLQRRLLCWKINHILVKFDHCIIVSLWTFQPTLVFKVARGRNHSEVVRRIISRTQ